MNKERIITNLPHDSSFFPFNFRDPFVVLGHYRDEVLQGRKLCSGDHHFTETVVSTFFSCIGVIDNSVSERQNIWQSVAHKLSETASRNLAI